MGEFSQSRAPTYGAENNTAGAARLFGQMTLLPLTTMVYSLELFVQLLKGVQDVANQSVGAAAGGVNQSCGGGPCAASDFGDEAGWQRAGGRTGGTRRTTREEDRKMSDQNWSSSGSRGLDTSGGGTDYARRGDDGYGQRDDSRRDDDWRISEDCAKTDPCDRLRLVRFKILFLKRNLEIAFPEQEELVSEDMPKDGFISWKVAEFIQQMDRGEVKQPGKWKEESNYPANEEGGVVQNGYVLALPDKDKRFLRVYCQVLAWYDREKRNYEKDQADSLDDINDELKRIDTTLNRLIGIWGGNNKSS